MVEKTMNSIKFSRNLNRLIKKNNRIVHHDFVGAHVHSGDRNNLRADMLLFMNQQFCKKKKKIEIFQFIHSVG